VPLIDSNLVALSRIIVFNIISGRRIVRAPGVTGILLLGRHRGNGRVVVIRKLWIKES
jgi:hypothetical protein